MIIDAHCHIGASHNRYIIFIKNSTGIIRLMDRFNIDKACVSSLKACQGDIANGNHELEGEITPFVERFIPFCVIHPRQKTAIQAMRNCIESRGWKGVKLHPYNHLYPADCYSAAPNPHATACQYGAGRANYDCDCDMDAHVHSADCVANASSFGYANRDAAGANGDIFANAIAASFCGSTCEPYDDVYKGDGSSIPNVEIAAGDAHPERSR